MQVLCWSALPNCDEIAKAVYFQRKDFGSQFGEVWVRGWLAILLWNSAEGTCHSKSTQDANYSVGQEQSDGESGVFLPFKG